MRYDAMSNRFSSLLRLAATARAASDAYYTKKGNAYVDVPQIVGITGACENIDTLFRVGSKVQVPLFFSQTGQLALEQALRHFSSVFTVMHSGRDEEAEDERHLRQFMLTEEEFDWSTVTHSPAAAYDEEKMYEALLRNIESAIKAISNAIVDNHADVLRNEYERDAMGLKQSLQLPFHRISYEDALAMLQANGFAELSWGADFTSQHEATVVQLLNRGMFPRPVFIMRYPKEIKFFNMKVSERDERVVLSADLVFPYAGEGVGSAVREHDGEKLKNRLLGSTMYRLHQERGGTLADFGWYLDLVTSGDTKPHAGYGIGNERVLQYITGSADIRPCSVFSLMAKETSDWIPRAERKVAAAYAA
jgi:asparaginyl-tRNA synthetase